MGSKLTRSPAVLLALVAFVVMACGAPANQGLPSAPGEYPIRAQSVGFDGKQYSFYWLGADSEARQAKAQDVKLVQAERTFLKVPEPGQGPPVLHLAAEEPVAVRHSSGGYHGSWFPFILPIPIGSAPVPSTGPPSSQPGYRYPPTDRFGQGDTLHGSQSTSRPGAPDYSRVQPAPNSVSGQNSGSGGGVAATNRDGAAISGQSGGAGAGTAASNRGTDAISGQAGGAGTGSAATDKATGDSSAATDRGVSSRDPKLAPVPPGNSTTSGARSSQGSSRPSGGAVGGGRRGR